MSIIELKDSVLFLVSQWAGTTVPRLLAVFVAVAVGVLVAQALWKGRLGWTAAAALLFPSLLLLVVGISPAVLHRLSRISDPDRLRIAVGAVSAFVAGIAFEGIRRSHLQERYALLWLVTSMLLLLGALVPTVVEVLGSIFGASYAMTVGGIVFTFILLVAFHSSLTFSKHEMRQNRLAQRCAELESRLGALERRGGTTLRPSAPLPLSEPVAQERPHDSGRLHGAQVVVPLLVAISWMTALLVGLSAREPMIGDEVTHFYMLAHQSEDLGQPSFTARIPVGFGEAEARSYPHVNAWHYLGAVVHRVTGRSFAGVQVYHSLFWLQFLVTAAWLARRRNGLASYAPILYVLLLASLPVACIFAVAYYQDVPAAAQILTAFAVLVNGHWIFATFFLLLAISIKETSFLFIPAFLLMLLWQTARSTRHADGRPDFMRAFRLSLVRAFCIGAVLIALSMGWSHALHRYAGSEFYPLHALRSAWSAWTSPPRNEARLTAGTQNAPPARRLIVTPYEKEIIANHPGDLRIPRNYVVYGGLLIWPAVLLGLAVRFYSRSRRAPAAAPPSTWLFLVGLSYLIPAAYVLRTAPDARFFLPAVPFLLLPFVEWMSRMPKAKWALALLVALAILQTGHVYAKVYRLRSLSGPTREAIAFLRGNPPMPHRVFMYPEGNYRLFPSPHDWYLNYRLREFWRADNDARIAMLNEFNVGAVVIKKHLISDVDDRITNLGVYPAFFVRDLAADGRFVKVFENAEVLIYRVPSPSLPGAAVPPTS